MTEHDSLERKIEKNAEAISQLQSTLSGLVAAEAMKREHVCNYHSNELGIVREDIRKCQMAIKNRWPNLVAAAIGAMLPVIGLVVAIFTSRGGQ